MIGGWLGVEVMARPPGWGMPTTEQSRTRVLAARRDSRREAMRVEPLYSNRSLLAVMVLEEALGEE